jgi:hypothetical protein
VGPKAEDPCAQTEVQEQYRDRDVAT